ncbi:hypothetical protein DKX38_011440 [Salix brachista]|uniref:FHA domain-containing protein n=1 Tax=Salix brachista TaxID=2182728 RepID=A0A5N5LYQ1_9ROSI|nr:hypothetical protein DKX38_011440 [Salix brachista]
MTGTKYYLSFNNEKTLLPSIHHMYAHDCKSPLASPASSDPSIENEENIQETEEILTFGRHPDCNIVLNHPSIRRFHLQINSKAFSQKLFVTDLSSDHGTWNPGKKIPGLRVELNEEDTIKVGGSTRYYRLLWVPLSRAYDMETPFISTFYHGTWNPGKKMPGLRVELNEDDTIKVGGSTRYYRLLWVPLSRAYDMETPFISPSDMTMVEEQREENVVFEEDESLLATESKPAEVKMYQQYDEHNQSPEYFSFQQELPETETKGSSMIRESNAELFSTRTSLSTARLEVQSASEMLGAIENGNLSRKGHEPINIFSLGIEMNFTANLMATLISSCSDDHAATDVLEVENHVLSRDDQENLQTSHLQTIRSREKNRGADVEWENQMLNGRIRIVLRIDQSQILFSLVQKQQKKSLPRQGELLTKYTSAEVLEKEGWKEKMDYVVRYSLFCGQGVKEVIKALTRSQEDSYGHSKNGYEGCSEGKIYRLLQMREQMIKLDDKKKAVVEDFGKRLHLIHLLRITSTEADESNDENLLATESKPADVKMYQSGKPCRFSNLDKCFLESLIPCTSLELGSLFRTKRLQIQETVKSVGGSVETVEPSINSDASESQNIVGSVETTERLEELNVSGSPLVGRLDELVEPEENMLIQESAEIMEYPQKFVSECPTSARFVETVEPLDMSEFCAVGRSVETAETLEKSNVSGSLSASRFAETLERPGKLDIAESPTAGGCLEQLAIAPETPIQCTTLLRSFESPERPDIYDEDGQSSETVKKEICRNLDQELDLNLLNEAGKYAERVGSPVYLSAVLEYLAAEHEKCNYMNQAFTGTNFDFSAYSSDLKSVLGISQLQLNYLAVASDPGKSFWMVFRIGSHVSSTMGGSFHGCFHGVLRSWSSVACYKKHNLIAFFPVIYYSSASFMNELINMAVGFALFISMCFSTSIRDEFICQMFDLNAKIRLVSLTWTYVALTGNLCIP